MPKSLPSIERLRQLFAVREDGALIRRVPVRERPAGVAVGFGHLGYVRTSVDGCSLLAHQIVWAMTHLQWAELPIDHINGNKGDNRPANLRLATNAQNLCNRGAPRQNTTGFKGVSWNARSRKFVAQIDVLGRRHYLGRFDDAAIAHKAYAAAATTLHGAFARTV